MSGECTVLRKLRKVSFVGCSGQPERLESRLAGIADLFELAGLNVSGSVVLDCGCGRGTTCCVLAALGVREAHGLDTSEDVLASFWEHIGSLPAELRVRLFPVKGDARDLPYRDCRFDAVLMVEVASHVLRLGDALREAFRVLKPGGALLISDGNNSLNPLTRARAIRRWEEKEEVRAPVRYQSYRALRAKWLTRRHPDAAPAVVTAIAAATPGKLYQEVEDAYEAYVRNGVLPKGEYVRGTPAINPGGWYDDRLLNAFELAEALRGIGFVAAQAVPYLGRSTAFRRAVDNAYRALPGRAAMRLARGLKVIAIK